MSVTRGLPSVKVPVLSKATVFTLPMVSKALPPLISKPRRAPTARPEAMAAGVDSTRAQGQAISNSAKPRYNQVPQSPPIANGGTMIIRAAIAITAGV